jgi:hypothetical protein
MSIVECPHLAVLLLIAVTMSFTPEFEAPIFVVKPLATAPVPASPTSEKKSLVLIGHPKL